MLKKAIAIRSKMKLRNKVRLEASGGVTLKNVRSFAKTGIDRISIGALTHTHKSIDFSLEVKG